MDCVYSCALSCGVFTHFMSMKKGILLFITEHVKADPEEQ